KSAAAVCFQDDDQPLLAGVADGKCRAGAVLDAFMRSVDRLLDVLRIEVNAMDDDQVFQPAGDEQLALMEEPQIARAQKWTAAVAQTGLECFVRRLLAPPVTLRHAGAGDPYFADVVRRERLTGFRVGDDDML